MRKTEIEIKKQNLCGMVGVEFTDGLKMFVNISDVTLLANNRVRVGTKRCVCSKVKSIQDGSEIYSKKVK